MLRGKAYQLKHGQGLFIVLLRACAAGKYFVIKCAFEHSCKNYMVRIFYLSGEEASCPLSLFFCSPIHFFLQAVVVSQWLG